MDLAADMLYRELSERPRSLMCPVEICPPFRRRFTRLPGLGRRGAACNADRLLNRLWLYSRSLRRQAGRFDLFHLCDHSYAQLVHVLPSERTGVFCHDLDTFLCVLEPDREPRPRWFRMMAERILAGMQKAAVVFHSTDRVRDEILEYGLVEARRLVKAPYGVCPEFTSREPVAQGGPPFLMHVGSCIGRKRIDVLLDVFAELRSIVANLRLVQIGGRWTSAQSDRIEQLGIASVVEQRRGLSREELAELYRQATLVLQPSEAEGFGLPVAEALACGASVLASDIPALREVGGEAAAYCPVGDDAAWVAAASHLILKPESAPSRDIRLAQARGFSWSHHAQTIVAAYERLLD